MCWLRVSKIHIPQKVSLFGQVYPSHATTLIQALFDCGGLISYQKIVTDWGQLSIGRFDSREAMENNDRLIEHLPCNIIRNQYFSSNGILQERIYVGPESEYDSSITGILLPDSSYLAITKDNLTTILYGKNSNVQQ